MKKTISILIITFAFNILASAQFLKIPKIEKPKLPTVDTNKSTNNQQNSSNEKPSEAKNDSVQQKLPSATILKPSLTVRAVRDLNYWKQPDAKNFWSWMPKVDFMVTGAISDASYFTVEFTMPDGKPWFSWDSEPMSVDEGGVGYIESIAVPRWTDKRSIIETGVFGFKITLKNSLQGTAKEMYRGKFKVNKKFAGTPSPDFKNQYAFYVDQDWALPIGYVSLDAKTDANAPLLNVGMWFRGDYDNSRLTAYLYYNGKQISTTTSNAKGIGSSVKSVITEGDDNKELLWAFWKFTFYNVRAFNSGSNSFPEAHFFKQNPGNYEIKVLLDGELVRTANFAVGSDGGISDNGIAAKNNFGGFWTVMPVKVIPAKEGALNLQAWKTDAFYENPLTGFSVQ
jgi:hypothetical protein